MYDNVATLKKRKKTRNEFGFGNGDSTDIRIWNPHDFTSFIKGIVDKAVASNFLGGEG